MASSEPLAAAERLYAALESDDVAEILELCGADVEVHYPAPGKLSYGGQWQGRDGVAGFLDAHDAAEEILEFEVSRMFADGDTVIAMGTFTGRARPSGREWSTRFGPPADDLRRAPAPLGGILRHRRRPGRPHPGRSRPARLTRSGVSCRGGDRGCR